MLTLFGKGVEKRTVMLDGGRLGQPDGVRVEDAFPALRGDVAGIFGIEIQLACPQARVNLLSSQSAVELVSPQFSVMYGAGPFMAMVGGDNGAPSGAQEFALPPKRRASSGAGLQDSYFVSSLVVVNAGPQPVRPDVYRRTKNDSVALQVGSVAAESALEIPLDEALFRESAPHECLWGLVRAEAMYVRGDSSRSDVGYYVMYRDSVTKRPVSVCSL
jgi:hypothetical protein